MTGLEEALDRLVRVTQVSAQQYDKIPWWNIKERFMARGSLLTLEIVIELLHRLVHKHDNHNGRLN